MKKSTFMTLWFVVAALVTGCSSRQNQLTTPISVVAPTIVPLRDYKGGLKTVVVKVAGKEHLFLFDTGAGVAMITPKVATELGCSPHGRMTGFRIAGDRVDVRRCEKVALSLQGQTFHHETVGVFDLMKLLPPKWPELAGVIGLKTFHEQPITLDMKRKRLVIESPSSLRTRVSAAKPIKIRPSRQLGGESLDLMVALQSGKGLLWTLLDSGCLVRDFILAPHAAKVLDFDVNARGVAHQPAKNGHPESWTLPSASITPVGLAPLQGRAVVKDIIYDGVICANVMQEWTITLDLKRLRGWVKQ